MSVKRESDPEGDIKNLMNMNFVAEKVQ